MYICVVVVMDYKVRSGIFMGSCGFGGMVEFGDLIGSCLIGFFEFSFGFVCCFLLFIFE